MSTFYSNAQLLKNPSFEGTSKISLPVDSILLNGDWVICSGTPDIYPLDTSCGQLFATEGETYALLIGVQNTSFSETIGQKLTSSFSTSQTYKIQADIADYRSSCFIDDPNPGALKVYLGDSICSQKQLIWNQIINEKNVFQTYDTSFVPDKNYRYIYFEVDSKNAIQKRFGLDDLKIDIITSVKGNFEETSCIAIKGNNIRSTCKGELLIYNHQGKEVKHCYGSCNLSNLPLGVYLWKYLYDEGVETGKIRVPSE